MARPQSHDKWLNLAANNGISANTYHKRVSKGWSQEKAATEKVRGIKKSLTDEEKAYICKFYEWDGPAMIGYALNKDPKVISSLYSRYQKNDLVDYYIQMWDRQFKEVQTGSGWF